jgi:hypothetical protein
MGPRASVPRLRWHLVVSRPPILPHAPVYHSANRLLEVDGRLDFVFDGVGVYRLGFQRVVVVVLHDGRLRCGVDQLLFPPQTRKRLLIYWYRKSEAFDTSRLLTRTVPRTGPQDAISMFPVQLLAGKIPRIAIRGN